jgi:quercetin dioxygenase-like cupin family protein
MTFPSSERFVPASDHPWEEVDTGVRRRMLGFDHDLMMVQVQFEQGSIGYVHQHPHRQVTFIAEGVFEVSIGVEKRTLRAGDCFFVPPDIPHGVVAREQGSLVDVFSPAREDFVRPKG